MEEKIEVQAKIIEPTLKEEKVKKEEFLNMLKLVAPGTGLRTAIEGVVNSGKGALIVVENESTNPIIDGGFKINARFTAQRLIELAKMDGAIVLSKDLKKIMYANVLLIPDNKIPTKETGTRHKAAERSAKMTGALVISVSERRKEINFYYKNLKYLIRDTSEILRRTTETLQILEKQRELFDLNLLILNQMEMNNDIHINQACKVIQKGYMMQKIIKNIEKNIIELGNEAQTIKPRIKEVMKDVEKESDLVIKDYTKLNVKKTKKLLESISYDELLETENILTALAQRESKNIESIKGWRILNKTGLEEKEVGTLIQELATLNNILGADKELYSKILSVEKAPSFINDIEKIKNENYARL